MSELIFFVFVSAILFCIAFFLIYFFCLFRHFLVMKSHSNRLARNNMFPVRERFSDGEEYATDSTNIFIPPPALSLPNQSDADEEGEKRSQSSFFQLPADSYYKFSLVDEFLDPGNDDWDALEMEDEDELIDCEDFAIRRLQPPLPALRPETNPEVTNQEKTKAISLDDIMRGKVCKIKSRTNGDLLAQRNMNAELEEILYGRRPLLSNAKELLI